MKTKFLENRVATKILFWRKTLEKPFEKISHDLQKHDGFGSLIISEKMC